MFKRKGGGGRGVWGPLGGLFTDDRCRGKKILPTPCLHAGSKINLRPLSQRFFHQQLFTNKISSCAVLDIQRTLLCVYWGISIHTTSYYVRSGPKPDKSGFGKGIKFAWLAAEIEWHAAAPGLKPSACCPPLGLLAFKVLENVTTREGLRAT